MRVVWHQMGGSSITSDDLDVPIPVVTSSDGASRARAVAVALGNYTVISSQGVGSWPEDLYLLGPIRSAIIPLRFSSRQDGHGVTEQHARLGGTTTAGSVDRSPRINTGASGTYR